MKPHVLLLSAALCFAACKQNPSTNTPSTADTSSHEVKTGGSKLIKVDGKYNIYTKKVGDGKIKVLLLNGGPGLPHDYMECFEDFLPKAGIEFYYYDQLGCGNSDTPKDTTLWIVPRYVEEVEQVRKGLGLDSFYIVGHSWGSMLAMEYLHKYQSHVKGAVLSDMTAGVKEYVAYAEQLKKKYFTPRDIVVFDSLSRLKKYDSEQYNTLLMTKLYANVLCRIPLEKWPEPLLRTFKKMNQPIYMQMQGPDEFQITGNFKNWEFWSRLPDIKTPILVLGAKYDEMNPEDLKREGKLLPNSRTYICPNGSHMAMYDDQQHYFGNLIAFLKDVDAGSFKPDAK
ncbi:proline iminopeptidase [Mucilaginibacter yixingensis]|uniref:Proline iminopeptidase n=1 Tax=Mucilaginibacter yixingensis TaxID=1295612 RepID=A0A2T5JDV4_9SPHI|nr:proline iminopeptidase-family hydrolase [Mucilaginibacter yixingensis]PTQ99933.1 proline iminopeptidase [Mucilaginibacter yixingensis]